MVHMVQEIESTEPITALESISIHTETRWLRGEG